MKNVIDQITELIQKRVSVRTYNNEPIKNSDIQKLNEFIERNNGLFEPKVRFKIFNSKEEINGAKLGTYGFIKGTKSFIGVAVEEGDMDLEELGYEMESLVLYATSIGLGTCWIAGSLNRSEFTKAMNVKENEIFPIISPIGYESDKKRIIEKLFKLQSKARVRKEWKEIFFRENFKSPILDKKDVGEFEEVLENLRLAPSAVNRQPWRVLKSGDSFHFYKDEGKNNSRLKGIDIQRVDIGIALCHFDLSCKKIGLSGEFIKNEPVILHKEDRFKYIISWRGKII